MRNFHDSWKASKRCGKEDEKRLFWRARVGGKLKEWEAEITNQVPDERVAWKSIDGTMNSGTVIFKPVGPGRTKVTATMEYELEGFIEKTGEAFGIPSGRVQSDLERFRSFIEERGRETGGWRGEIKGEKTSQPSAGPSAANTGLGVDREVEDAPYRKEVRIAQCEPKERTRESAAEIPISEEELKIGKRTVGAGEVKLHKKTTNKQVNVPVELKHEDAVLERVPAEEMKPGEKEPFQEHHVEVPLNREEPVVEKETSVTGASGCAKRKGASKRQFRRASDAKTSTSMNPVRPVEKNREKIDPKFLIPLNWGSG